MIFETNKLAPRLCVSGENSFSMGKMGQPRQLKRATKLPGNGNGTFDLHVKLGTRDG
jgi:hypothetical protein